MITTLHRSPDSPTARGSLYPRTMPFTLVDRGNHTLKCKLLKETGDPIGRTDIRIASISQVGKGLIWTDGALLTCVSIQTMYHICMCIVTSRVPSTCPTSLPWPCTNTSILLPGWSKYTIDVSVRILTTSKSLCLPLELEKALPPAPPFALCRSVHTILDAGVVVLVVRGRQCSG